MRKLATVVFLSTVAFLEGCCTKPPVKILATPLDAQQTGQWCWAASGEMTMDFLGGAVDQCDEANKRSGRTDCCNSPTPDVCVFPGWPEYAKYNFTSTETPWGTALSWTSLRKQTACRKKAIAFAWGWPGGGGHMMVARGYLSILGQKFVVVNNPWPPPSATSPGGTLSVITYDYYVSAPGDHSHYADIYDITKH